MKLPLALTFEVEFDALVGGDDRRQEAGLCLVGLEVGLVGRRHDCCCCCC